MQKTVMLNAPEIAWRYWTILCFASVLCANLGDVMSRELGLGYWRGLPVLIAAFAIVVMAARLAPTATVWYWVAIVLVRGAATNLADWQALTDDRVPTLRFAAVFPVIIMIWTVLFGSLALRQNRQAQYQARTNTDLWFWAAMLAAGTLGTSVGDWLAFNAGIDLGSATLITSAILIMAFPSLAPKVRVPTLAFWVLVLGIRTWGTNVGDYFVDMAGLWPAFASVLMPLVVSIAFFNRRGRAIDIVDER